MLLDEIRERDEKIVDLFSEGYSIDAVARTCDVSHGCVEGVLRREMRREK